MSKTACIFHGTGGNAESFWIPWLAGELEKHHFEVWAPSLPDSNGQADLAQWQAIVNDQAPRKHYSLMIGHSAGVPLIWRLLSANFTADHVLSVAGFMKPLPNTTPDHPSYPRAIDTDSIKSNCARFTFFHSDNDPWGCDINQGEYMRQNLGGTHIICSGEGHFGSNKFEQPYKTFPMLLQHCLLPH